MMRKAWSTLLVSSLLAAAGCGGSAAPPAHPLVAALHGPGLLPGRVIEIGLDRRRRSSQTCGDLRDRGPFGLTEVTCQRDRPGPSGLKATVWTPLSWPRKVVTNVPNETSKRRTSPSKQADATTPCGPKATPRVQSLC